MTAAGPGPGRPIRVLYIAGWGRSGSTILGNILGHAPGLFHVGELRYIWDRSLLEDRRCGCGELFSGCETWRAILQRAYGGRGGVDPGWMLEQRERHVRTRHLPLLLLPGQRAATARRLSGYLERLARLYRAVLDHTGARVIVDSSKFPTHAYALDLIGELELYVVHLVRDPRAVAFSWMRHKRNTDTRDQSLMVRHGPLESTALWLSWNLAIEALWGGRRGRYLRVRYEDLVERPRPTAEQILALVGAGGSELPFLSEREVRLSRNHTVSGNPNRSHQGAVELRPDDEWQRRMRPHQRLLVDALAWPRLAAYGYPVLCRR